MEGYKAFYDINGELYCRNFHYEIGKTYEMDDNPVICEKGFHFCKAIADCYYYYPMSDNTRICKVEAFGDITSNDDGSKYCTNKIRIIEEVTESYERKGNSNSTSTGFCNSGNWNSGDWNSGNRNSGNCNSGNRNSGDWNSGNWNSGDRNSGDRNSGNWNSGDRNSGDRNSGNWNSGDWNKTNHSSGVFNTKEQKIMMFNKPSDWTFEDWKESNARYILQDMPQTINLPTWTWYDDMTDEEKKAHPECKTLGGYLKVEKIEADVQKWWNELSEYNKQKVLNLSNFDAEIFKQITGIEV